MDYCTRWLEGWWAHCCAAHDSDYVAQVGQLLADERLQACVASTLPAWAADSPVLAAAAGAVSLVVSWVMYRGVRTFGRRYYARAGKQANDRAA